MGKIAVTMLDVDEVVTAKLGALRRDHEIFDQALDLVVADHRPAGRIAEFLVEQRMVIGDDGFEFGIVVRFAEAAGMGELQTDDEVVLAAGRFLVRVDQDLAQLGDILLAPLGHRELLRIGAPVGPHRAGFAAPDEFCAA